MKNPYIELFICLLFAHIVGDFLLQTSDDVKNKYRPSVLSKHSAITGAMSYIFCGIWKMWPLALAVFVSHFFIDYMKVKLNRNIEERQIHIFLVDQVAHIFILALIVNVLIALYSPLVQDIWWVKIFGMWYLRIVIFIGGFILTVRAGAMAMEMAVRPFLIQLKDAPSNHPKGLKNGGRFIGQLERALIFLFVMAGQPSAIGFLIAAKSILRFGDIKGGAHRMEAEYIIIGTLMSFLLGLLIAYGARLLMLFCK